MNAGVCTILQARMASSRLPGKTMLPIWEGKGALELMLERVQPATTIDRLIVATTDTSADDPLEALCARLGVFCFRGAEDDVLDRYFQAARAMEDVTAIVRLTADCPLHDAGVVDEVVETFLRGNFDYVSNTLECTYPDGLDTEVFSFDALERAWHEARLPSQREHVTPYIRSNREQFRLHNVRCATDLSALRWTLDEPLDLEFLRAVYRHFGAISFGMRDVLRLLERQPHLSKINEEISRNEGYAKLLHEDRSVVAARLR